MRFTNLATELKDHLPDTRGMLNGEYVLHLVDMMLRPPMTDEEALEDSRSEYNPLHDLEPSTLSNILTGKRRISKKRASNICSKFDGEEFESSLADLLDSSKEQVSSFFAQHEIEVKPDDVGYAVAETFRQIIHGFSQGLDDVDIRLNLYAPRPSVREIASDKIFFDNGKLVIDGAYVELPINFDENEIYEFENRYISALCAAYAEVLSRDEVTRDDIDDLPVKYQQNFKNQRRAFLSAESVQRSIREVYEDGENQFDILKGVALEGINATYYDDYDSGYRRLLSVLNKITDISLDKSKLMLIKNLIGNLERRGIVHILVEDGSIPSWVNPYDE